MALYRQLVLLLAMFTFFTLAGTAPSSAQIRLALISPHTADTPFWKSFSEFASAAADDLGVQLEVHHAAFDRNRYKAIFEELTRRSQNRPNAVIMKNERGLGPEMLQIAESSRMPVFFMNAGLKAKEKAVVGGPRKRFKLWLGEILPDNEQAGYVIAKSLIRLGLSARTLKDKPLLMAGLSGASGDLASQERVRGMKRGIAEFSQATLVGVRSGGWVRKQAAWKLEGALKKYPATNLVWAANDDMALGAIDALRKSDRNPGRDALIGGLNWRPEALAAIRSGSLAFSVGGHFMEGAWAVVLLHDYFRGKDFSELGVSYHSSWGLISSKNIERLAPLVGNEDWGRIDFRRFSRVLNPKLKKYDFSLKYILAGF